jgi:hypothetical protein
MEITMVGRPWPKGTSGNQGQRYKEFTEQIRIVVREIDPTTRLRKLRRIAMKVVDLAMEGEGWACCMVADRLEGKPATEATVNALTERPIRELSDDEIEALILAHKSITVTPSDETLN